RSRGSVNWRAALALCRPGGLHYVGLPDYKPVSVPLARRNRRVRGGGHSSRPPITERLQQPTRKSSGTGRPSSPIWSCSAWGFPSRTHYCFRGALLPHLFTLTRRRLPGRPAVYFLWHFPSDLATRPAVSRHAALWRPDFPLPKPGATTHP